MGSGKRVQEKASYYYSTSRVGALCGSEEELFWHALRFVVMLPVPLCLCFFGLSQLEKHGYPPHAPLHVLQPPDPLEPHMMQRFDGHRPCRHACQ